MKKMKFRKLSRVLISISLVAIIAVSLISVPVSAAEGDTIIGEWIIKTEFTKGAGVSSSVNIEDVDATFKFYSDNVNYEVVDYPVFRLQFNLYDYDERNYFRVIGDGDNGRLTVTFGGNGSYEGCFNSYCFSPITPENEYYNEFRVLTINSESSNPRAYELLSLFADKVEPPPSLLENILGTFSEVGSWIGTIISSLVALFWSVETASLTFLGILSVAGLAFSVIMLLFSFVTRFVGFSG